MGLSPGCTCVTQIMELLMLAPDIQEAILFLPRTVCGGDRIHLRQLQPIAVVPDLAEAAAALDVADNVLGSIIT